MNLFAERNSRIDTENAFKVGPHIARVEQQKCAVIKLNLGEIINFDEDAQRAYGKIKTEASKDDLILVTGTNYIAKEIFNEN